MVGRATASEGSWFVRRGDHVDGPHPVARILAWHREGKLPDDILLSRDGQTWRRVRWGPKQAQPRKRD
jgi:hypothetical protein